MRFDIVPLGKRYRGKDRCLTTDHLWTKKTRKLSEELLEEYFKYIDLYLKQYETEDSSTFEGMLTFYRAFCMYDIPCEMMVYDKNPVMNAFGYPVELLGIDIVHDMCESLIVDNRNPVIQPWLNENGLCKTEDDVEKIISLLDCGTEGWGKCYVYRVQV